MPLLSIAIWLPILSGVLLLAFGRDERAEAVRWGALLASLASFLVTIPLVTGFNMAGEERLGAVSDFVRAFDMARDAGLGITVHAGELCGAVSVRDAPRRYS